MEMLTAGEYSLLKKNVPHGKKSMIFVKLTDSAQRALNNYFLNQDESEVPIIEFNKDVGRILIPNSSKNGSESEMSTVQFKFNVDSNIAMQGKQGCFECVQHKRGITELIIFGQLTRRLIIHANEDVYETTKNRMAAIELEQRKNCTVRLDWNSAVKRKCRINRTSKLNSSITSTVADVKSKQNSNVFIRDKSLPNNNKKPGYVNGIDSFHSKRCTEDILLPSLPNSYKRPGYINGADGLQTKRQRISHLNKPEISANNCDNFPTYDSATSIQIKKDSARSKSSPQLLESPLSPDTDHNERLKQKPKYLKEYYDSAPTKPLPQLESPLSPNTNHIERLKQKPKYLKEYYDSASTKPSPQLLESPLSPDTDHNERLKQKPKHLKEYYDSAPTKPSSNLKSPLSSHPDTANTEPFKQQTNYLEEYITITNMDQRIKYKNDFRKIFSVYERLRVDINTISDHFAQLRKSLLQHKRGSPKYSRIEAEIFKKYYTLKQNPKFEASKNRLDYLHDKLSHIKNLVQEYDERKLK